MSTNRSTGKSSIVTSRRRIRRTAAAAAALAALLGASACGSTDDGGTADADVASLDDGGGNGDGAQGSDEAPESTEKVDPEEAFIEFAECMRENGVDMDDPEIAVGPGGGVVAAGRAEQVGGNESDGDGPSGPGPDDEEFQAAHEACGSILDDARGEIEVDPEREAEMREEMLAYSECMRENGVDMPDPVFDDNGGVSMEISGDPFDEDVFEEADEICAAEFGGNMRAATAVAGPDAEDG